MANFREREPSMSADKETVSRFILQAKAGRSEAFDWLVRLHQGDLRRFVGRRIPTAEDVADLCQDVLVRAYLKLNQFNGRSTFRTWLRAIARRAVADFYRMRKSLSSDTSARADGEASQTPKDSVAEVCEARQQIGHCLACLTKNLPLEDHVAVILCDIYGFNDREGARIMAKSLGAFKHLLHRARARMDEVSEAACVLVRKTGDAAACGARDRVHECQAPPEIPAAAPTTRCRRRALKPLRDELVREVESLLQDHFSRPSRLLQLKASGAGLGT